MTMKLLILCVLVGLSSAWVPVTKNKEPVPYHYVIKLKADADPSALLDFVYKAADLDRNVEILQRYEKVFHGFSASLTDGLLSAIQEFDVVESIEEDGIIHIESVKSWGLDRIDQKILPTDDIFQPCGTGAGVTIYVLDTGINYEHEEFEGRNVSYYSVIDADGTDGNGHGTHCAATAAGNTYGVAKEANIVSIKCMGSGGAGYISDIVAALEWVAANATTPAVVSMSIAGGSSEDLDEAVKALSEETGILVVVAAGNGGEDACDWSPSRAPNVLTVGATNEEDYTWSKSNIGPCVDIMAPGVDIVSAWKGETAATKTLDGTSMATPHVAGAAAILLAENSNQTSNELKGNILTKASTGKVRDSTLATPNLLVYIGEGSGGGSVPEPTPCGATITVDGSDITSPNFPSEYDTSTYCNYYVEASSDYVIMVDFSYFLVEEGEDCMYDSLTIYDGDSVNSRAIRVLCGESIPGPVYSSSSTILLVFASDSSVTYRGFKANVHFVDKALVPGPCVYEIRTSGSTITSPNYPSNYVNHEYCQYTVIAEENYWIELSFTALDIEDDDTCYFDKLRVYDGSSSSDPLLATLCGSTIPSTITSSANQMFLHFTSDYLISLSGFKATVTFLTSQ